MQNVSFSKPSPECIHQFQLTQSALDFTYPDVGATSNTPPIGYVVDRTRIKLGCGKETFEASSSALRRWEHFNLGWAEALPKNTPIEVGNVVIILAKIFGLWWLNASRIVYVINEDGPIHRFGFAYGTLPGHAESGEERFLIEWNRADDTVWYDILAFSRPNYILTRIGYPFVRKVQKRFANDSATAVLTAVIPGKSK